MQTVTVSASSAYPVYIGGGLLERAGELIAASTQSRTCAVVTDSKVGPLYAAQVCRSLQDVGFTVRLHAFPAGERNKNLGTYGAILEFLAENKLTRSDFLVALGGGVVGDMAGFAAATYQRGIGYIQMPTTFLAASDSSVGGKTAIDLAAGKNLAGAFYQSLMDGDIRAQIDDVVRRNVEIKASVVGEDEFERGRRKLLNFGHTLGHAIEKCSGYAVTHGHAVAAGMALASRAAERLGYSPAGTLEAVLAANKRFGLPSGCPYAAGELYAAATSDKKRSGSGIDVVVLEQVGQAKTVRLDMEGLRAFTEAAL